ncbi:unnamed protein product [Adineta steineri]|uniref:AMP-dependent synthetase/ligase domain-containing protein n=2 Tax=Adineta steineri TaxID=433720 RepID=A0A814GG09_9BILA|nr:unnamed protein product [Adineta steineri]
MNDNNRQLFTFIENTYETDEQLVTIINNEKRNSQLFDLTQGLVFRCHLVYYKQISSYHLLSDKDLLIFNFHHALFDFPSMNIFLHDLNQAYTTGQLLYDDNTNLRYLDYAVIEQQMSMTGANMFWLDALHDCKLDQPLPLPFDRYRLANEYRTGRGTSISFDFGQDLSNHFLIHASSNNISLKHLTFAIYFLFLFKLTNGQKDLCLAMSMNNNRYKDELKSIIGLFENVIPLRCQLDPYWCFHQLLEHVRQRTTKSMKYSYFPLQRILNQHSHISKHAFLDTSLEFVSYTNNNTVIIADSQLTPRSFLFNINEDETLNVSDFSFSIHHDMNMNQLSCTINASLDLFNIETVEKISQRFNSIIQQLSASIIDNQINNSIYEIQLVLPNERLLIQSMNSTQISFSSPFTCIHHAFVYQVMKHPQKIAVELDEQSLTYCELLHYVQVLSVTLVNEYHVIPGEIVCQCIERSLSMVIGIMGIEMAGGVYCPLSPRDPQHRLHSLIQQTQSRFVLVHDLTKTKFYNNTTILNIESILIINDFNSDMNYNCLSSVIMKGKEIAYIIFTSGSTGTPKAVQVRHKNFIDCIHSLAFINSFNKNDTVIQMTRCSFDIHIQEILSTFLDGGTLIMLHPGGTVDFDYLSEVLENKQITYMHTVPSFLQNYFVFLENMKINTVKHLRSLCSIGEAFVAHLIDLIVKTDTTNCIVWNLYGPAETTIASTYYRVDQVDDKRSVSIGRPLSNYRCMIINQYLQSSVTSEGGELCVGGVGVFAGYLGRDDLTAKALVEIDGQLFYRTGDLVTMDNNGLLHYQDAVIEKQMLMTGASMFWLDVLHDCKLDQPLSLPFDRYRLANEHRTGRGTSISFDFGQDPSHDFLTHASLNNISLEHLTFAIYFIFLLKQTNGQTDLCTAININNNRYRDELKSIIGLFENVIPLRCQLDPNWSFHQLLEHVQEIIINSMKYSYFPLQRILNQHPHISKHSFLDTSLEFISSKSNNDNNAMMIGDSQLVPKSFSFNINGDEILSVSDFSLSIYHDINMNQLSCTINASLDLFNRETVEKISQRFHFILHELSASINDNRMSKPIYELSLVLPNEQYLMQSLSNTQVSFPSSVTCIHHEFVYQVMKHPQKLAVELDEQSLTYAELFAYVQMLAVHLLDEYGIIPSEVISQCVERSLSMVIGIMTIEMAGGVYFPLSFRDPQNRLHTLLQQTQSRLVLSHYLTKNKFNDLTTILDIDSILVNNNLFQHIDIDQLSSVHVTIDSIAYIIFTSGSTGVPKGVSIEFAIQLTYNKGNK